MIKDNEFLEWLSKQRKQIKIKCQGAGVLALPDFQELQGNLKSIKELNLIKLIKSILKFGFIAPIFIYNNKEILDGHGRLKALYFLEEQKFAIPEIPVVYINAKNKQEAKKMLLAISSHYQDFEMEEVSEWLNQFDEDISDILRITDMDIKIDDINIDNDKNTEKEINEFTEFEHECPKCGHKY